jgi:hypothetical protein
MNWTAHHASSDLGLVIDDAGKTIAVAYDTKDTALLAAAPAMREALKQLMDRAAKDAQTYAPNGNEPIWAYIADAADALSTIKEQA